MNSCKIPISIYGSLFDAEIARSKLKAFGIEAYILMDDCGSMRPDLRLSRGVSLFVDSDFLNEANEILSIKQDEVNQEEEFVAEDDSVWKQERVTRRRRGRLVGRIITGVLATSFLVLSWASDDLRGNWLFAGGAFAMLVLLGLLFLDSKKRTRLRVVEGPTLNKKQDK